MAIREQNQVLLFKHQSGQGVQATPSASTDAIKIVSANVRRDTNMIQTNEKQSSLDTAAPIPAGTKVTIDVELLLRGSGAAGTPPEIGPLLESSYFKETITATAVPSSAEAAAAGSTTSVTLASGATGTAQLYRGMPIDISGAVTAANGMHFISDYTAGKVATLATLAGGAISASSDYQIPVNVRYAPTSVEADVPFGTMELYTDGKKETFMDVRGTVTSTWEAGGIGRATIQLMGIYLGEEDAAVPANPVFHSTKPPAWAAGRFLIDRVRAGVAQFQLGANIGLQNPGDPNEAEGFGSTLGTTRDMRGTMDPLDELVATRDVIAAVKAGSEHIILAQMGSVAGNRIAIVIPKAQYMPPNDRNDNGLRRREIPFKCNGPDAGAFIVFY